MTELTEKNTAKLTLKNYVNNQDSKFYTYHNPEKVRKRNSDKYNSKDKKYFDNRSSNQDYKALEDFFESTLDEMRLKKANSFSKYALAISGNIDLAYFRGAASKREFAADMDYNMQRDHAVHTLYNYILGWYLFEHSEILRSAFCDFIRLKIKFNAKASSINREQEDFKLYEEFGSVWSIVSLLHDIGYILEGTLSSASPEIENERVIKGSKIVHDFFNHHFWRGTDIDFRLGENIASMLDVSVPKFVHTQTLASLGDHLCDIGTCENIRKQLDKEGIFNEKESNDDLKQAYGLNFNAFSIWKMFYEHCALETMKAILEVVFDEYKNAMWHGSSEGFRNLNHGVCSGLIVLQAKTFIHDLNCGLIDPGKANLDPKEVTEKKISNNTYKKIRKDFGNKNLNAVDWFKKDLWATAAVAVHDLLTKRYYGKICKKSFPDKNEDNFKISLFDDPLAYLGILVDTLQEWDRYTVMGEPAFSDKDLLQGNEVELYSYDKKIYIKYPQKNEADYCKDIGEALGRCLKEWKKIVYVEKLEETTIISECYNSC